MKTSPGDTRDFGLLDVVQHYLKNSLTVKAWADILGKSEGLTYLKRDGVKPLTLPEVVQILRQSGDPLLLEWLAAKIAYRVIRPLPRRDLSKLANEIREINRALHNGKRLSVKEVTQAAHGLFALSEALRDKAIQGDLF